MLDARYKDRYADVEKKQGLRETLTDTAGQDGNGHSDGAHRRRGPTTDRDETSLLDMHDEILVENETTEQNNKTAQQVSERNRFRLCFTGNGDIRKCQQSKLFGQCGVCNLLTRQVS